MVGMRVCMTSHEVMSPVRVTSICTSGSELLRRPRAHAAGRLHTDSFDRPHDPQVHTTWIRCFIAHECFSCTCEGGGFTVNSDLGLCMTPCPCLRDIGRAQRPIFVRVQGVYIRAPHQQKQRVCAARMPPQCSKTAGAGLRA